VARQDLEPVRYHVTLLQADAQIAPGVRAISAPGHTPGHSVVQFTSGDQRLYYIGDAVLYPLHLKHPDWLPIYDILPEKAAASKRAIFDRVAAERALVVGQHFPPFPSLGHVVKEGQGWRWQPIER